MLEVIQLPADIKEKGFNARGLCELAEARWLIKLYWHHLTQTQLLAFESWSETGQAVKLLKKGITAKNQVRYTKTPDQTIVGYGDQSYNLAFGSDNYLTLSSNPFLNLYLLINVYNGPWLKRKFRISELDSSVQAFFSYTQDVTESSNPDLFLERQLLIQLLDEFKEPLNSVFLKLLAAI